jgi:hypothetical protein
MILPILFDERAIAIMLATCAIGAAVSAWKMRRAA